MVVLDCLYLVFLHFVLFAFCYICILSHLRFVTIALCLICILLHLQFVPFAICPICILIHLHFVGFAFCLFLRFCYICILSRIPFICIVWKLGNFRHHETKSAFNYSNVLLTNSKSKSWFQVPFGDWVSITIGFFNHSLQQASPLPTIRESFKDAI